jgi:23S rRNA (guanosine2251-2'-O)-methyltransferase
MKTCCPYIDCMAIYKIDANDKVKSSLVNATCPQCKRSGRVKSLEIISTLKRREKSAQEQEKGQVENNQLQNSKVQNTSPLFGQAQFHVLLEDIRSLWNVGSIFRTADAIGVSRVYLSGITGCPPSKAISKTALGAELCVTWQYLYEPLEIMGKLKASGITIVGLERNVRSIDLVESLKAKKIGKPLCLVVGNENAGLSPELLHYCDYLCDLPMRGTKESLNVASAFAVAAYFINEYT